MASQRVVSWKVIYSNCSVYSSKNTSPEELPLDGVQWIVEFLNSGKRYVHGMDYYRWTGDSWAGGNEADLRGWLRLRTGVPIILYGLWISDAGYEKVARLAEECCDD